MTAVVTGSASRYATPPTPRLRRFTVDEYHRLIEDGYFAHDERFELLEGWIVAKVSRNPIHDAVLSISMKVLDSVMPAAWHVRVQSGFTTSDSEPEPDLAVVRGDERDYTTRHPGPADAALVIEVANTSLPEDRDLKARIYARANVGVYWIINVTDRVIEVFTDPSGPAPSPSYANRQQFTVGESVPLVIPGSASLLIPVADFMP